MGSLEIRLQLFEMHITIAFILLLSLNYAIQTQETCKQIEGNVGDKIVTNCEEFTWVEESKKWVKTNNVENCTRQVDSKGKKGCRKPNGKEGTVLIHNCQEYTCSVRGKKYFWKKSKLPQWEICCVLNNTLYEQNSLMDTLYDDEGCPQVSFHCDENAKTLIEVNPECGAGPKTCPACTTCPACPAATCPTTTTAATTTTDPTTAKPSSTSITSRCGLIMMLTKVGQSEITIQGEGSCSLTLLLVGGGGHGGGRVGGGSGYLEYRSLQVSAGTQMIANVGDQGQSSSLTISGGDTITAQPGENGQGYVGGSGYSGGGGGSGSSSRVAGDGGSNGGDGEDGSGGNGGSGTGQDVSLFTFTTWSLGPGAGGRQYSGVNFNYGGGGGGVLVNGAGPQGNIYQGAGYGGGGRNGAGHPGLILVEIGQ